MNARDREKLRDRPRKLGQPVLPRDNGWTYDPKTETWTHTDFPGVPFVKLHGSWVMLPLQDFKHPRDPSRKIEPGQPRIDRYEPSVNNGVQVLAKQHLFYGNILALNRALQTHIPAKYRTEHARVAQIRKAGEAIYTTISAWELSDWQNLDARNKQTEVAKNIANTIGRVEQSSYLYRVREAYLELARLCFLDARQRNNPQAIESKNFWAVKRIVQRAYEMIAIQTNLADEAKAVQLELRRINGQGGLIERLTSHCKKVIKFISTLAGQTLTDSQRRAVRILIEESSLLLKGTSAGEGLKSVIVLPYGYTIGTLCANLLDEAIDLLRSHSWQDAVSKLQTILDHLAAIETFRSLERSSKLLCGPRIFAESLPDKLSDEDKKYLLESLAAYRTRLEQHAQFDPYLKHRLIITGVINALVAATQAGDRSKVHELIISTEKTDGLKGLQEAIKNARDECG